MVQRVYTGSTLGVVVGRRTADVDNHIGVDILNLGIDMLSKVVDTFVLQTHAVEHTRRGLGHAGIVVALTGVERGALHDDGSEAVERNEVLKLKPVAEGARGGHHGVLQLQAPYIHV